MKNKYKFLKCKMVNNILTIRLNRASKKNALSNEMKKELINIAQDIKDNSSIRVVILHGEGDFFCAGNDIIEKGSFGHGKSLIEARKIIRLGPDMIRSWSSIPTITIAAINGGAIGGGFSIALACDFRVLSKNAYFRAPEVELGIHFSWHSLPRLTSLVGPSRAKRIGALCEKIDASQAFDWGLCDKISSDPYDSSLKWAKKISKLPNIAQTMVKESIERSSYYIDDGYRDVDQVMLSLSDPESVKARKKLGKKIQNKK